MSRSLKKAPYVEEKLFNRIVAMNEKNEKKVIKPKETQKNTLILNTMKQKQCWNAQY